MEIDYTIDKKNYKINVDDTQLFTTGNNIVISDKNTDITYGLEWYDEGYTIKQIFLNNEFLTIKNDITRMLLNIITEVCGVSNLNEFSLETYHKYVNNDDDHFKIVSKTRDLFSKNFDVDITSILPKFENILGFKLSDVNPITNKKIHIIVRINRPGSTDFNPPHKDVYESYDRNENLKFLNFWIPIAGVTELSSLPIVPQSHRLSENLIVRTTHGGIVEGKEYRVRYVREWNGSKNLVRTSVKDGEVLMFSSHLIHGLAMNDELDTTRVALEFRLFKK